MLEIEIPGSKEIRVEHIVLDYDGTIAAGGEPIEGVLERLERLAAQVTIHIMTADTNESTKHTFEGKNIRIANLCPADQAVQKRDYIWLLGRNNAIAIGNGRNDEKMFGEAAFAIGILDTEGACVSTLLKTSVIFRSITEALDALLDPRRLIATLRV
jgi:soluble P-type ATPase